MSLCWKATNSVITKVSEFLKPQGTYNIADEGYLVIPLWRRQLSGVESVWDASSDLRMNAERAMPQLQTLRHPLSP